MKKTLFVVFTLATGLVMGGCASETAQQWSEGGMDEQVRHTMALPPHEAAKVCLETARELEANGYPAEAAVQYERARRYNPRLTFVSHKLAVLYDRVGDTRRALIEYGRALENNPNDSRLLNDVGYFYYSRGHYEASEKYLAQAVKEDPGQERGWINLAMTYAQQGRYEESLVAFKKVVDSAAAHSNVGMIMAQHGRYGEAKAALRWALSLQPELVQAKAALAWIERREQELDAGYTPTSSTFPMTMPHAGGHHQSYAAAEPREPRDPWASSFETRPQPYRRFDVPKDSDVLNQIAGTHVATQRDDHRDRVHASVSPSLRSAMRAEADLPGSTARASVRSEPVEPMSMSPGGPPQVRNMPRDNRENDQLAMVLPESMRLPAPMPRRLAPQPRTPESTMVRPITKQRQPVNAPTALQMPRYQPKPVTMPTRFEVNWRRPGETVARPTPAPQPLTNPKPLGTAYQPRQAVRMPASPPAKVVRQPVVRKAPQFNIQWHQHHNHRHPSGDPVHPRQIADVRKGHRVLVRWKD